ncbi:hypothetical protein CFP56_038141 [Quercus suber]|uniref:Uncharacterized protein n=1 Tax=Quercus suber TaxID=58331 RepID=A0AAW0J3C7_QUESU
MVLWICSMLLFAVMACLSLATRNRIKKRKLVLVVMFWLDLLHITWTARKFSPLAVTGKNRMLEKRKEEFKVLKDASENLSKVVIGVVAVESRSKINEELLKLTSLTNKEHHKATKLIACQHELIDVFLRMLHVEKEE